MYIGIRAGIPSGGFAPSWAPGDVAGLILDMDASAGITLNGADVSAWADQSAQVVSWVQATESKQPLYSATGWNSALPEVTFTRGDVHVLGATPTTDASTAYTVLAAVNQIDATTDIQMLLSTVGAGGDFGIASLVNPTSDEVGALNAATWRDSGGAAATGEQILTWHMNATTLECFRDGTSLGTVTYDPTNMGWGGVSALGGYRNGVNHTMSASVARILVYNTALGASDLADAHSYMTGTYL